MTTDLEDRLRTITGPSLNQPLNTVLARGSQIRRRRAGLATAATAATIAVAASITYAVTPTRHHDDAPAIDPSTLIAPVPARTVSFSGGPTNLTDAQLSTLTRSCLHSGAREDNGTEAHVRLNHHFPSNMRPNVAERRGDEVRAVFVSPRYLLTCFAAAPVTQSGTKLPLDLSLTASESLYRTGTHPEHGLAGNFWTALLGNRVAYELAVPTTVKSVVFTFPGKRFKATMVDGAAVAWAQADTTYGDDPNTTDDSLIDHMGFIAYDANGNIIKKYNGSFGQG